MNPNLLLAIPLLPLLAAIIAGLVRHGTSAAPARTASPSWRWRSPASLSIYVLQADLLCDGVPPLQRPVYTWLVSDGMHMQVGFLIDRLTALMMVVVTFVSLCVHVYTIGYMHDDPGYQRFFSYISLFTFSMLMLVMSNNFMQLFFGWEAVGVVSYLLIGFWYTRPTRHLRQPQGLPRQPRRRLRLRARHRRRRVLHRIAGLPGRRSPPPRRSRSAESPAQRHYERAGA